MAKYVITNGTKYLSKDIKPNYDEHNFNEFFTIEESKANEFLSYEMASLCFKLVLEGMAMSDKSINIKEFFILELDK